MNPNVFKHWNERGWTLDVSLLDAPGEIINTGGGPYYVGEAKEAGYSGDAHPLIATRYCMGMRIGRPLHRNELVRFRSSNRRDFRLDNLVLHSKTASAAELYQANGDPILGYSHCLCGCGTELDLQRQKDQPYAFHDGHRPKVKEKAKSPRKPRRKTPEKKLDEIRDDLKKIGQPFLVIKEEEVVPVTPSDQLIPIPEPVTSDEDPMCEYRLLFEKMIRNLPWEEFKELLHLLLEIQTRRDRTL